MTQSHEYMLPDDFTTRIMQTSPVGIVVLDADGRIIIANQRAEKILGISQTDARGRYYNAPEWRITALDGTPFPEQDLPFHRVKNSRAQVFDIQHLIRWPDGREVALSINASPLSDPESRFNGMVATLEDITARLATENRYEMMFQQMLDGFALHEIITDDTGTPVDYRFLDINPAFERLTGLKKDAVIGRRVLEILPEIEPFWIKTYGSVALTGTPETFENYSKELDRHFHVTAFRPAPGQFASIFSDITRQKKSEKALIQSQQRFLTVLNSIDAQIYVCDMKTHEILFMNAHMKKIFGKDFSGQRCYTALRAQPAPCAFCRIDSLLDEKGQPTGVHSWQGWNPVTHRHYMNYDRAIEWTDGRMVKIQVAMDTTEMKTMETELLEAQKLEAIGILAGGIAHDFNNILFPILGLTELLLESDLIKPEAEPHLKEIRKASNRAKDLVRQILTISRQSTTHTKVPVDIRPLAKEVIKLSKATLPSTIRIAQKIAKHCPLVLADPVQIHQILLNLITNAFQAMEDEGGILTVAIKPLELEKDSALPTSLPQGTYISIEISDTGKGMDDTVLGNIFDPYFSTKAKDKGTGLGLSIVKGVLANLNGDIFVQSKPGEGSTFTVILPAAGTDEAPESNGLETPVVFGSETILVVDDEAVICKTIKMILEKSGYKVIDFQASPEAFEAFSTDPQQFDIVITDMTMPDMTGLDFASKVSKVREDIPVIMLTGYDKQIPKEKLDQMGIAKILNKPLSKSSLLEAVKDVTQ